LTPPNGSRGADVVVHEHIAAIDLGGDALSARDIACDDTAAESEHRIIAEEMFGPAASVLRVHNEDAAIAAAGPTDTAFGADAEIY
jgi:hypothetical protein